MPTATGFAGVLLPQLVGRAPATQAERLGDPGTADPLLDALLEPVRQALTASSDLMTFREALLTLYPDLDPSAFAALMGQALAVADAAGYWEAQDGR